MTGKGLRRAVALRLFPPQGAQWAGGGNGLPPVTRAASPPARATRGAAPSERDLRRAGPARPLGGGPAGGLGSPDAASPVFSPAARP